MIPEQEKINREKSLSPVVDNMIQQLENRDWGAVEVKRYFANAIEAFTAGAIAAAVAAEREACAAECEALYAGWDEWEKARWPSARDAAAAIRARGEGGKE